MSEITDKIEEETLKSSLRNEVIDEFKDEINKESSEYEEILLQNMQMELDLILFRYLIQMQELVEFNLLGSYPEIVTKYQGQRSE